MSAPIRQTSIQKIEWSGSITVDEVEAFLSTMPKDAEVRVKHEPGDAREGNQSSITVTYALAASPSRRTDPLKKGWMQ